MHKLPKPTITAQISQPTPDKEEKNFHYIYFCIKGKKNEDGPVIVEDKKEEAPPAPAKKWVICIIYDEASLIIDRYWPMFKHEEEDEEQLLETLALTSKLERSLRKIASSRKYNTI